jgi:hypothetical protein
LAASIVAISRDPQFVHEAVLQRAVESLTATTSLRRIRRDVFHAEPGERAAHLREPRLVHRAFRLGCVKGPMGTVRIKRHRNARGPQHGGEAGHDRVATLARIERRVQHPLGRIIGHRDQARAGRRIVGEPLVHAPIHVQQLPETGARLAPPPMLAPGPVFLDQARGLERLLQKAIGHRDPVLPPRNFVKMPDIEATIPRAIELQQARHLWRRHAANRRPM